jgi:hypothetical protein
METVEITREWLDSISDEHGLTKGQQVVLTNLTGEPPYVGKCITAQQANFLMYCKGYRPKPVIKFGRGEQE